MLKLLTPKSVSNYLINFATLIESNAVEEKKNVVYYVSLNVYLIVGTFNFFVMRLSKPNAKNCEIHQLTLLKQTDIR